MYTAEFPGINTFLRDTCRLLLKEGTRRETRGKVCYELPEPYMFKITNPTSRLITISERRNSLVFPYAESLWLASGRNDMAFARSYCSTLNDFSDDELFMRGGYGPRLRHFNGSNNDYKINNHFITQGQDIDQFLFVSKCFERDPETRQAVINIGDPTKDCFENDNTTIKQTKDFPCTRMLHFIKDASNNKLNLIVTMRSNDLIWGASGVNIFNFTFMQEYFASILGLKLGSYYHTAHNMHFYEEKKNLVERIAAIENVKDDSFEYKKTFSSLNEFDALLKILSAEEEKMRQKVPDYHYYEFQDDFFRDWYNVLYYHHTKKKVKFINPILDERIKELKTRKDQESLMFPASSL